MKKTLSALLVLALAGGLLASCASLKADATIVDELNKAITEQDIKDVEVAAVENGVKLTAGELQFEPDSAVITELTAARLDKIGALLQSYQNREVLITGHTADVGDAASQLTLSYDRAKAVADYFIAKGYVKAVKVRVDGRGGTEPLASNDTDEGKARNRRVEIILLK